MGGKVSGYTGVICFQKVFSLFSGEKFRLGGFCGSDGPGWVMTDEGVVGGSVQWIVVVMKSRKIFCL